MAGEILRCSVIHAASGSRIPGRPQPFQALLSLPHTDFCLPLLHPAANFTSSSNNT